MTLGYPVPFDSQSITTDPLKPDGSDYPCQKQTYDISTMNKFAVNEAIDLKFNGNAAHGGGTCQIAVTLDKKPSKSSVFKIIKVYEGGCPTTGDGNGPSTGQFDFKIPTGFPSGQASLAWVWYNKIGNREIYMNCAPITITGGSGSKDVFNSLPNLYVVNLPPSECSTEQTSDLIIPHPGKDVERDPSATFKDPTGPSCVAFAAAQTAGLSGYQTESSDNNGTQLTSSAVADVQATPIPAGYGSTASSMITVFTASPAYSIPATTTESADTPASYPTLTASSGAGIYGPGTAAGVAAGTGTGVAPVASLSSDSICSTDGAVVCNGLSQFGLCDHGKVVWQAVAAGTTCSNGSIQRRSSLRHAHIRRHAQHNGVTGQ